MGCGYCKEDGHTINTCKAEGVEEEKLRRMSDPKEIRKREKAREKREEKVKALHDKHDIAEASEGVCLHRPSIVPGHVHDSFLQRCKTVEGVIECLLTEELVQVILIAMERNREEDNLRRETRYQHRLDRPTKYVKKEVEVTPRKGMPGGGKDVIMTEVVKSQVRTASRGRLTGMHRKRKLQYWVGKSVYSSPITKIEVKKLMSLHLYSAKVQLPSLRSFWTRTEEHSYTFIQRLFSRDRAQLLYHCFRFTEDEVLQIEDIMNKQMEMMWVPATAAVVDETLVAHKGRKNPHHVFIMRKPHPHGIKVWSLVDYSGYFYSFSLFRRNCAPEKSSTTLCRMSSKMPTGSLITADSYFGSVEAMEELSKQGKYCLFSCNQNRPSALFRDYLCERVAKEGDSASLTGTTAGPGGDKIPFMANTFVSKGRKICTLSNVFSDTPMASEVEQLVNDETEEAQYILQVTDEIRPEVRNVYSKLMDFVDNADQYISSSLSPIRRHHWTSALIVWGLTMLLCVNGRKLFQSATGCGTLPMPEFREYVRRALVGLPPRTEQQHPSAQIPKGCVKPTGRCRSCLYFYDGKITRTVRYCELCGPICKRCDAVNDKGESNHSRFYILPTHAVPMRRDYKRNFTAK